MNSATKTGTTIGYTYDANGNRLTQTGTSASTYSASSTSNRLNSVTGALARSYNYSNDGSVLTSGATTHTYYNNARMKTAKLGSAGATTYVYNALGQRVKKTTTTGATLYMYDEAGHLLGEYTSGGTQLQETIWLGDIPVATVRNNGATVNAHYIHTDQLNTPRKITNSDTPLALRWRWDPTPFGESAANESPTGLTAFAFNLRFPGQQFDAESNLSYNYFRDYESAIGKYVEADPLGLQAGLNLFAYVSNSPALYGDPRGLEQIIQGCGGALGVTVCDGNNGFEIRNCGKGCVRKCVQEHEEVHVSDYRRAGRCRNRPKGANPAKEGDLSGDNFFYKSECRAYRAGKKCAEAQKATGCCAPGPLDDFINAANQWMRYFKCDQLMHW